MEQLISWDVFSFGLVLFQLMSGKKNMIGLNSNKEYL